MDFDKLAAAIDDDELPKLFAKRTELCVQLHALNEQQEALLRDLTDTETAIAELIGVDSVAVPNSNGTVKQMTCSVCQQKGHNKKGHDNWVKNNPDHPWVQEHVNGTKQATL